MKGDTYWNRGNKYYFIDKQESKDFSANSDRKIANNYIKSKKINRPFEYSYIEKKSASMYFPVTGPKTFRKTITWIKIQKGAITLYKDVRYFYYFLLYWN